MSKKKNRSGKGGPKKAASNKGKPRELKKGGPRTPKPGGPKARSNVFEPKKRLDFGISIGEVFTAGFRGYFNNAIILTLAGLPVLITMAVVSTPWRNFNAELQGQVDASVGTDNEITSLPIVDQLTWIGLLMLAAIPAGTVAFAWFRYALDVVDGKEINIRAPFLDVRKIFSHFVATFWFWLGIGFGIRFLFGIPSVLVIILYAFYGFVIAEQTEVSGLKALGTSIRLGQGRRIGLFAIAGLMFVFNIFGVIGFAVGLEGTTPSTAGIVLGVLGLSVTTSITLVSGATIYRVLEGK